MAASEVDEWGPWLKHDGTRCPVRRGTLGEAELRCGLVVPFIAGCGTTRGGPYVAATTQCSAWVWRSIPEEWSGDAVIRYRIRKPRGLIELVELVESLPVPSRAPEGVES